MSGQARRQPVAVVVGPTASGKSALALALAARLRGTVINADSMQVYRELPILTAQPSAAERAAQPHLLYGHRPAAEAYSVAAWCEEAAEAIAAARSDERLPVLVGGTGLYLDRLRHGLAPVPAVPEELRARLRAELTAEGAAVLHRRLAELDAEAAARLPPQDGQRILRALEVVAATGRPLARYWRDTAAEPDLDLRWLVLLPPRDWLRAEVARRFGAMLEAGAVAEVEALLRRDLDPTLPAMKAVGVREIAAYLRGDASLEAAAAAAVTATRQYVKRQTTWLRGRVLNAELPFRLIETQFNDSMLDDIVLFLQDKA